jgi:hypothetical protein
MVYIVSGGLGAKRGRWLIGRCGGGWSCVRIQWGILFRKHETQYFVVFYTLTVRLDSHPKLRCQILLDHPWQAYDAAPAHVHIHQWDEGDHAGVDLGHLDQSQFDGVSVVLALS